MFVCPNEGRGNPVNINKVYTLSKVDETQGSEYQLHFDFQDSCEVWYYNDESERNKDYNLILRIFGKVLDEWK